MNEPVPKTPPSPRADWMRFCSWSFKLLPLLLVLGIVAAIGGLFLPGPLTEDKTVIVPHGARVRDVAEMLDQEGAVYSPLLFRFAAKVMALGNLKAGEYKLNADISTVEVVAMIHEGRSVVRLFTVAEGLTSQEIARLLTAMPELAGEAGAVPAEGSMLPESYRYIYGDSRAGMVARMQKAMQETLDELWAKRDPSLPIMTPEQALVMASVIEKETGKAAERPRIAGVFYNRLRYHMRLQSDPTVIYAIQRAKGFMDHDIEHADLSFPSPYNTYVNDGLPPKPICNPGRAALEAALHPETNDYLYFVADGTGGHVFAKNLAEHNQNVARWNALQGKNP